MKKDHLVNGVLGVVVGDALGVPVEFRERDTYTVTEMIGEGTYGQKPGTWSDDSSMTIATLESLGRLGIVDPADIMENFRLWYTESAFTPYGEVFDVGYATSEAIRRFIRGTDALSCGGRGIRDNGNGSLMRILPVAVLAPQEAARISSLTHAHPIACFACEFYAAVVQALMAGAEKREAFAQALGQYGGQIAENPGYAPFGRLAHLADLTRGEIKSTGYVVDSLEAALWCLLKTESYRDALLLAVNLGKDTDTVGAITGGLAGICYGRGGSYGIPEEWIRKIPRRGFIRTLCLTAQKAWASKEK